MPIKSLHPFYQIFILSKTSKELLGHLHIHMQHKNKDKLSIQKNNRPESMKIKVNASTIVKPSAARPSTTLWTSNLDMAVPASFHMATLYFYRSTGAADFFDPTVLKEALSRVLVVFYPVAGRLKKDDKNRIEIDCNGEGALFVEAESDGTVDDFADFNPRPELSLIPKVDYSQGISTVPLLLVQVTRFRCGGVCLGLGVEHQLSDGISSIHFINTWSNIACGRDVAVPPFFDRRVLSARNPPQPKFANLEYQLPPTLKTPRENSNASETILSIFKLTRDQLNALKANCLRDDETRVTYSTYEMLAGHVWRSVTKARGLPQDQETMLCIPVEGRSRLQPPLPPGFFGNVVFRATCIALCGELESNPLEFAVCKIHEAIARMDDEYLRSAIDYLELHGELDHRVRGAAPFKCPNLGINSWAKFPFYDADFGWGRPVYLGFCTYQPEGLSIMGFGIWSYNLREVAFLVP